LASISFDLQESISIQKKTAEYCGYPPNAVFWVSLLKEPCEKTRKKNAVMEGVKNFRFFRRPEWQSAAMPEGGQRLKESCIFRTTGRRGSEIQPPSLHF